jgi:hypothetical protein
LLTALVVVGGALGFAGSAGAEPRLGSDRADLRRQLVDLQRREHELDDKIRRIEAELERDAPARPRSLAPTRPSAAASCALLPFYLDTTGIKHLRPECAELAAEPSCDPPYNLDEQGVRRFRPGCMSDVAASGSRSND